MGCEPKTLSLFVCMVSSESTTKFICNSNIPMKGLYQVMVVRGLCSMTLLYYIAEVYIIIYIVTQFGKTTLVVHNDFEQTNTFRHSRFGHFAQEANYTWYL